MNNDHRNLQKLETEIFKVKNGLSPELMNDVFEFIEKPYFLRKTSHFWSRKIRTSKYGIETPYLGPKLWNLIHRNIKLLNHLQFLSKNQNLGPRELSFQVMRNIYSPNGFYLSSPHDNSRILIKSQYIKKRYLLFYRDISFFHFWLTSIRFVCPKQCKTFFVNHKQIGNNNNSNNSNNSIKQIKY